MPNLFSPAGAAAPRTPPPRVDPAENRNQHPDSTRRNRNSTVPPTPRGTCKWPDVAGWTKHGTFCCLLGRAQPSENPTQPGSCPPRLRRGRFWSLFAWLGTHERSQKAPKVKKSKSALQRDLFSPGGAPSLPRVYPETKTCRTSVRPPHHHSTSARFGPSYPSPSVPDGRAAEKGGAAV